MSPHRRRQLDCATTEQLKLAVRLQSFKGNPLTSEELAYATDLIEDQKFLDRYK